MMDKIKLIFAMMLAVAVMQLHASESEPIFERKNLKTNSIAV